MDFFWRKNKKKVKPHKATIVAPNEKYMQFLDFVIQEKSFDVVKVIECGYFGGSITVKQNEPATDIKVNILKVEYVGKKECMWEKFNHRNILPLLKLEYLQKSAPYLFYLPAEEITHKAKIEDKLFKKDPQALRKLLSWLTDVADVAQYLHNTGYAHLNIQSQKHDCY